MGAQFFEDLDSQSPSKTAEKPFWALDFNDEDEVLGWLNSTLDALIDQAQERHDEQKKNLATYRGIQYRGIGTRTRDEQANEANATKRSRNPRVIYNHTVDLVEHDVARITKYRGAIAATPESDENRARIKAQLAESSVEGFWNKTAVDDILQKHRRRVRIFSEDFIGVFWNRNAGPYDPQYLAQVFKEKGIKGDPKTMKRSELRKAMREIGEFPRLPLLDESGRQLTAQDGSPLWIDKPMRRGDVAYRLILSWDMFLHRPHGGDYEQVEYGFWRERVKTDTVRAMHPTKASKIEGKGAVRYFDTDSCEDLERSGEMEVWHFYHKSTDTLDQGRYIKFVRPAILQNRTNPYSGWDDRKILPWVRTVDIDTPAVLNGDATVTHIRGPQAVYNNLVSLRVRNRYLLSHPKWFYQAGSVNKESLGNQTAMVPYKPGAPMPSLAQPALAEGNESEMMSQAENVMQKIGGVYGPSRGDPPAGITAGVALTLLDEQENERANPGIQAHTLAVKNLALQTVWIMADYYDDDRIEQLVGKNKAAELEGFSMSDLHDIGDLKISSTSALPQQKAARTQFILDMKDKAPQVMTDDRMIDFLELGDDKRMRSVVTVAVRKAEKENASMMNGADADAPEEQEFQLQHYRVHLAQMNETAYRRLPEGDQERFKDHVMAHEMFLWAQTLKNPQFAALVMQEFPGFPLYFKPKEIPVQPSPTPPMAPPPGMEGAPAMPPPGMEEGLPPGAEMQMPPDQGIAPGAETMIPEGALI